MRDIKKEIESERVGVRDREGVTERERDQERDRIDRDEERERFETFFLIHFAFTFASSLLVLFLFPNDFFDQSKFERSGMKKTFRKSNEGRQNCKWLSRGTDGEEAYKILNFRHGTVLFFAEKTT